MTFGGGYDQPAPQPAHADHAGERQPPGAAVDVPDRHARQLRNDDAGARQHPVRDRAAECGLGARRAHAAGRSGATAASCPRTSRRAAGSSTAVSACSATSFSWSRSMRICWRSTGSTGAVVWDATMEEFRNGYAGDHCADRREGQGHRRRGWWRVRHSRLHRRLRRADGQARVALLHDSRARRAGPRHLGRRFVEDAAAPACG